MCISRMLGISGHLHWPGVYPRSTKLPSVPSFGNNLPRRGNPWCQIPPPILLRPMRSGSGRTFGGRPSNKPSAPLSLNLVQPPCTTLACVETATPGMKNMDASYRASKRPNSLDSSPTNFAGGMTLGGASPRSPHASFNNNPNCLKLKNGWDSMPPPPIPC
jgi:hypothetical protein